MAIILIETTSPSAADDIVEAVEAGTLWGVDMGTTSKAAAYSDRALVECTKTRAGNLLFGCPENATVSVYDENPSTFTGATEHGQIWYLRGLIS